MDFNLHFVLSIYSKNKFPNNSVIPNLTKKAVRKREFVERYERYNFKVRQ